MSGAKTCLKCQKRKPISAFGVHSKQVLLSGTLRVYYRSYCKPCDDKRSAAWHKSVRYWRREVAKKRCRIYDKTPARRAKNRVRSRTRYAIAAGKLKRKPCEVCGVRKSHAHHDDYSKALDVRWLCSKHHAELHISRGEKW